MKDKELIADQTRFKWWSFLLLGLVLLASGGAAIPAVSKMAAGLVLGAILAIVGIAKITQAFETKEWPGFLWQLLAGGVEIVGGVLIYFNPLKGGRCDHAHDRDRFYRAWGCPRSVARGGCAGNAARAGSLALVWLRWR